MTQLPAGQPGASGDARGACPTEKLPPSPGARCRFLAYGPADAIASQNPIIISCLIYIQTGFTFLVPVYQGCPGKEAVKRV